MQIRIQSLHFTSFPRLILLYKKAPKEGDSADHIFNKTIKQSQENNE